MKCNGWMNYETWICALWLANDEETYRMIQNFIAENKKVEHLDFKLQRFITDFVEESMPDLGACMYADILQHAIEKIDFIEIAESYLED